jgi:hypothetical protein
MVSFPKCYHRWYRSATGYVARDSPDLPTNPADDIMEVNLAN